MKQVVSGIISGIVFAALTVLSFFILLKESEWLFWLAVIAQGAISAAIIVPINKRLKKIFAAAAVSLLVEIILLILLIRVDIFGIISLGAVPSEDNYLSVSNYGAVGLGLLVILFRSGLSRIISALILLLFCKNNESTAPVNPQ